MRSRWGKPVGPLLDSAVMPDGSIDRFLADLVLLVLLVHVGIAVFVVGGLAVVLLGQVLRWRWVDRLWFRAVHLAAIAIVVAESWLGFVCPLTTLEMWLRARGGGRTYGGGFIEHWFERLLFHEAPPCVFTASYSAFGLVVLATWWFFPPTFARRDRAVRGPA